MFRIRGDTAHRTGSVRDRPASTARLVVHPTVPDGVCAAGKNAACQAPGACPRAVVPDAPWRVGSRYHGRGDSHLRSVETRPGSCPIIGLSAYQRKRHDRGYAHDQHRERHSSATAPADGERHIVFDCPTGPVNGDPGPPAPRCDMHPHRSVSLVRECLSIPSIWIEANASRVQQQPCVTVRPQ